MSCAVCRRGPAAHGVLCEDCRDELARETVITAEQIQPRVQDVAEAALVDMWGRAHRLERDVTVGRDVGRARFIILTPFVSRAHAVIAQRATTWSLRDLGASNGTFVDGAPVYGTIVLADRARVRFGPVAFFFVAQASGLPPPQRADCDTLQPFVTMELPDTTLEMEPTRSLPPHAMRFVLSQPMGGGGGVVEIDGRQVQLTIPQFEMFTLLVQRRCAAGDNPDGGFVSGAELLHLLSLESPEPGDDSIRQMVRRIRRSLQKAGIPDLIESRPGLGYRLRTMPRS